jgi:adenylyltransferase/sulfurtransferase
MAAEAVKVLAGTGRALVGRILTYHALDSRFREVEVRRNRACAVCGEAPRIHALRAENYARAACSA